ncbi:DUF4199 domain-containing protein [Rufibacter psychrotolerans]|uniref:DUF4199 domain-containing protein n=1 Tax=Rufibacter psychrotolerans TaxID=2812556 RepID=UPI00196793B4|nr:DUF4199 domain-containing protein [Rufibacter sp. SYSU D00308]
MNEQTVTPTSAGLRYGLITGFILIIYSLVLYLTELNENTWLSALGFLILVGGLFFAFKYFKADHAGFMSYGQGLGTGTILGAVVGVLVGIFSAVYINLIDPSIMQKQIDLQVEQMENRGLSDEQIEQSLEMVNTFSGPVPTVLMSILLYALGAFLLSLVIAAIMKRSRPEFE